MERVKMNHELKLRVGILSAAKIVYKTWPAIHRAGHEVTFIGCRDSFRAETLVRRLKEELKLTKTPKVGSYDDVIKSPDVDVVYIPLPCALRNEYVLKCIQHGKHVVGEKPAAVSAPELYSWLEKMAPRRLLYMDGTMFSHSSRVKAVLDKVKSMGGPIHIDANCSFLGNDRFMRDDIRVNLDLEPFGALGDLGWYALRWVLHLVDFNLPESISARVAACTSQGAITAFEANLRFRNPETQKVVSATIFCSFVEGYQQHVRVLTKKGVLTLDGAISPTYEDRPRFSVATNLFTENFQTTQTGGLPSLVERNVDTVYAPNSDEVDQAYQCEQLWRDVSKSLMRLSRNEPIYISPDEGAKWSMYAFRTQLVLDALLNAARENKYDIYEAKKNIEAEEAKAAAAAKLAAEEAAARKEAAKLKKAQAAEEKKAKQPPAKQSAAKKSAKSAPAPSAPKFKINTGTEESDFPFSLF